MVSDKQKKDIMKTSLEQVKMVDTGVKNKYGLESAVQNIDSKDRIYYPSLHLSSKEAPVLTGTDVEDEVTLIVKGIITGHSLNERSGKKDESFTVEIHQLGVVKVDEGKGKE